MTDNQEAEVHEGRIVIGDVITVDSPADLKPPTLKFVHYPGAQQLVLWLPRSGYQGYDMLTVLRDGQEVERADVMSRLNGSVQMLFNTLPWPPGDYAIVVTNRDGFRHEIALRKLAPDVELPPPPVLPPEPVHTTASEPIVYRDGEGRPIPNVDLDTRAQAQRDLTAKFSRRLEYEGSFRAGTVIYLEGERRIRFWHEMCGGDMKFAIDIPTEEAWEVSTGTPLSERDGIITFVAARVQQEQCPSWRYEITARSIDFY